MLSVDEATAIILKGARRLDAERAPLNALCGRVAADDVSARMTQPPHAASAMDGYAVRFEDATKGARLRVIGEAPAGAPFEGRLSAGEAVRIFTGGVAPEGADHIVIQENVSRDGDMIVVNEASSVPRHIRAAGIDFKKGDILVKKGTVFHEIHGALLAAANVSDAPVVTRPVVALFSNGDELVEPGSTLGPGQIVNSNHYAIAAMIESWGGVSRYLGRAPDDELSIAAFFRKAERADIVIPIGGASVGDHDYVKSGFAAAGGEIVFEKVAVRPGKPTWFGKLGETRVIGLPGNPASAIVTAALFAQALVRLLAATEQEAASRSVGTLTAALSANGAREAYLRANALNSAGGEWPVAPAADQDSSLLAPFADANVLIKCAPNAPAAAAGDRVELVWLR